MSNSRSVMSSFGSPEVAWRERRGREMAVIGIEFTSGFAQVLFTALLVVIMVLGVWLLRRLRRSEAALGSIRRENGKLRNEIANITGWTTNGRLPDDWQERLRNDKAAAVGTAPHGDSEQPGERILLAAHHALLLVEPPHFASKDSAEQVGRSHKRIVDLIEGLAHERIDPLPALANGDLDRLLCLWRRLEVYFPDRAETDAYGLAAYAVLDLLKRKQVVVTAPRPLSVENTKNCVFTTDDVEKLRDISRIRTAALAASSRFTNPQGGEELVIDCERPGWSGPNGHRSPRILILDRSW
ncbi:hypothetical protein PZ897_19265 [Hoeflea sp. YIM 152468]|uniref:hypothetical protein n=1 Tax=Hoeflea sp. YIM 152468 TaxID=3031759 RepID=UPI0023DBD462|nr:hypothetical protein [Hoeflea sp. YIM 152468]MDF1610326.1 hypothetical protein [Hoeflea sp. YIM 152468]